MSDNNLNVIFDGEHPLHDGGKVEYYNVGSWTLEICFDKNGVAQLDGDGSVEHALEAVEAWQAWAAFVARKGWEAKR